MTELEQKREDIAKIIADRFKQPSISAGLTWDTNFMYMLSQDILELFRGYGKMVDCPECKDKKSFERNFCSVCDEYFKVFQPLFEEGEK